MQANIRRQPIKKINRELPVYVSAFVYRQPGALADERGLAALVRGTDPKRVDPLPIEVMREGSIDVSQQLSKSLDHCSTTSSPPAIGLVTTSIFNCLGSTGYLYHLSLKLA